MWNPSRMPPTSLSTKKYHIIIHHRHYTYVPIIYSAYSFASNISAKFVDVHKKHFQYVQHLNLTIIFLKVSS